MPCKRVAFAACLSHYSTSTWFMRGGMVVQFLADLGGGQFVSLPYIFSSTFPKSPFGTVGHYGGGTVAFRDRHAGMQFFARYTSTCRLFRTVTCNRHLEAAPIVHFVMICPTTCTCSTSHIPGITVQRPGTPISRAVIWSMQRSPARY